MAKKSYHPPAIIEASQFERRTLLTGCAKANPACTGDVQTFTQQCQLQGPGSATCQNANFVS